MKKRKEFLSNLGQSVVKFPIAHVALVFLTSLMMREIYQPLDSDLFIQFFAGGFLTLLLAILGSVYVLHQKSCDRKVCCTFWGSQVLAVVCGICYGFLVKDSFQYESRLTQFGVLLLVVLAIFAVIAFLMRKNEKKIWYSWTSVFQAVAFGGLAGVVVWGGLSAAFGSIQALFELDFDRNWYQYFWAFSVILLGGSFVLNHYLFAMRYLPLEEEKDIEIEDSRSRKIFGVYIFLPLALVYLAIFLAYGAKILISGLWPKGILVWLGTGFFVWGMLTIYATFTQKDERFEIIRKILLGGFLFVGVMMAIAILKRIGQYGITINRYFICELVFGIMLFSGLALWLKKYRFWLFISIFLVLSLIGLYGPFNAVNVSYFAQKTDLELTLMKDEIYLPLGSGDLKRLSAENNEKVAGLLKELTDSYESERLDAEIFSACKLMSSHEHSRYLWYHVSSCLELEDKKQAAENDNYRELRNVHDFYPILVDGYKKLYHLYDIRSKDSSKYEKNHYSFTLENDKVLELDFTPYLEQLKELSEKPRQSPVFMIELENGKYKFVFSSVDLFLEGGKVDSVSDFNGYLLEK